MSFLIRLLLYPLYIIAGVAFTAYYMPGIDREILFSWESAAKTFAIITLGSIVIAAIISGSQDAEAEDNEGWFFSMIVTIFEFLRWIVTIPFRLVLWGLSLFSANLRTWNKERGALVPISEFMTFVLCILVAMIRGYFIYDDYGMQLSLLDFTGHMALLGGALGFFLMFLMQIKLSAAPGALSQDLNRGVLLGKSYLGYYFALFFLALGTLAFTGVGIASILGAFFPEAFEWHNSETGEAASTATQIFLGILALIGGVFCGYGLREYWQRGWQDYATEQVITETDGPMAGLVYTMQQVIEESEEKKEEWQVILDCQVAPGKNAQQVKSRLAKLLNKGPAQIDQLYAEGRTVVLKRDLSRQQAEKIKQSLAAKSGAEFIVGKQPTNRSSQQTPPPPPPA